MMIMVKTHAGTFEVRDEALALAVLGAYADEPVEIFDWDVDTLANTYEPVL